MFLILPNQLFEKNHLSKEDEIILYEHPHYFKKYKYNKKKLILHRASMKYYFDYLKKNKFNVRYIEFNEKLPKGKYKMFDPIDKIKLPKAEILDNPNFLFTNEMCEKYRKKTKKFFFNAFYMWGKKELDIMPKIKSQDKDNRKSMPKGLKIPKVPSNKSKYIKPAISYVNKNFPKNYGNTYNFMFPVEHKTAKSWLKSFIKNKFKNFGPYQDFIHKENNTLFHSIMSSSINIGLINPSDILKEIFKIKSKIPINSFEGYVRQLFWREYQRYCSKYYNFKNKNYFGNNKKLTKAWYNGTTGIKPIDDCIENAFDTAYLHHIERLMVVGNFMNISKIKPSEGYRWFMEFSCDAYEWVMNQNVLDMVFFVTGGDTMRRPYASSSNYILKMSNYKRDDWCDEWDKRYKNFLKTNKEKLWKFRYFFRGLKNL